jgi:hypothetical protein
MATWIETTDSMSATIQRLGSRSQSTVKKVYRVFNANSDTEVHNEASARFSGAFYVVNGMSLLVDSYDIACVANGVFDVTVTFTKNGEDANTPNPLSRSRQFDTTGTTQHFTQAESETAYGSNVPSQAGAINVDGDRVVGVDAVVPSLQWSETYDVPSQYVSAAYIRAVAGLTGTVNNAAFRTFAAGEVLFVGCSGSQEWDEEKGNGPWRLSYKFVASPNRTNFSVGSVSGITKKGHEYLWVRYEDTVSSDTQVKTPKHVYVNQIYKEANFAALGIGS